MFHNKRVLKSTCTNMTTNMLNQKTVQCLSYWIYKHGIANGEGNNPVCHHTSSPVTSYSIHSALTLPQAHYEGSCIRSFASNSPPIWGMFL